MSLETRKLHRCFVMAISSAAVLFAQNVSAQDQDKPASLPPVRVSAEMMSGLDLGTADWPDKRKHVRRSHAYEGEELTVTVYESTPKDGGPVSTTVRTCDFPFDEFVYVLSGKAVLTDETGYAQEFVAGDSFVMRKGFCGTWEEVGVYRELVVIMTESRAARMPEVSPIE